MLTVLCPARNAADDIPGWLGSVERFADAAICLDDGSTDETAALLGASPLVTTLLRNPVRETYAGWDDAANRQALLDAAIEAGAEWVLFLDADERIDADDAEALRGFLERDALPVCAYALQLFRCWGSEEEVEATPVYVFRLFHAAPGQRIAGSRLHFNPLPDSIPPELWVRTTLRARHLDSLDRTERRNHKYREADPEDEFAPSGARRLVAPQAEIVPWTPRPAGLAPLAIDSGLLSRPAGGSLTVLCPARNAADDIPGWLGSVERFADAAICLDDGSTDETAALLGASPLVTTLLRNPVRETYAGWDDAANRQALLDAAIEAGAEWVLFLDADERIDADDAEALRGFLERDADPSKAYAMRVFRMSGDLDHYDRSELWVARLFHAEEGQTLDARRLHLVPVPTAIAPRDRLRTTIRIQHLGGMTAERRARRVAKYEQADPERRWQLDYSRLAEADAGRPWPARPEDLPVLADPLGYGVGVDVTDLDPGAPALSAVVISRNDVGTIAETMRSILAQETPEPFEVILAASGDDGTRELVAAEFPEVRIARVPEPGLPGAARNAGLEIARGDIVSFPGSHVVLRPGSLAARIRAHRLGYAMVTGSILNGNPTSAGWAAYFLDHSRALPGRPSEQLGGPPSHCSYLREPLLEVGGFPEDTRAGEDTIVNRALFSAGYSAYRAQDLELVHVNRSRTARHLARHHFNRGRAYGRLLAATNATLPTNLRIVRGYPLTRLRGMARAVRRWGGPELEERFESARGLIALGALAATAGALFELLIVPGGDGELERMVRHDRLESLGEPEPAADR
ncbi:glycosyltransferase [Thermoleophilia bacterium SCSIO 60948]|nr:glycosyltransferase [Thermoleophilia bacterium SCSIO 60948]